MDPINRLLNLLRGAGRFPHTRQEVLRLLAAEPKVYLPVAIAAAIEDRGETGETAARLVTEFLEGTDSLPVVFLAYDTLPINSTRLVRAAILVYRRLLAAFKDVAAMPEVSVARLENNLSELLHYGGETVEALAHAQESVRQYRQLAAKEASLRPELILSLNTLAKRLAAVGRFRNAVLLAEEAAEESRQLRGDQAQSGLVSLGQSQTCLANRLGEAGETELAAQAAMAACATFAALAKINVLMKEDWAFAALAGANRLIDLGGFAKAQPYAKKSFDLFRSLMGHDADRFLEYYLAAANALSITLAEHGSPKAAAEIAAQCIENLRELATQQPQRFLPDYAAYLITYSASQGEQGDFEEARCWAYQALREAKRLSRVLGRPGLRLEGLALNNLFNREYERGAIRTAAKHAAGAAERFKLLSKDRPEFLVDLAQSFRNHAEGLRLSSRNRRDRTRAVNVARQAVRAIERVPPPRSDAVRRLHAHCLSALAHALAAAGRIKAAVGAAAASLELRRSLMESSPKIYRTDYAFGLYTLADLRLKQGEAARALPLATEAVREYARYARVAEEHVQPYWAEALRTKAYALTALNRPKLALRCLAKRVGLLRDQPSPPSKTRPHQLQAAIQDHDKIERLLARRMLSRTKSQ